MDARTCRAWVAGVGMVLWTAGWAEPVVAGQDAADEVVARTATHVRPLRGKDRRVTALLHEAPYRSPTVARLLAVLERSDVLVSVELRTPVPNRSGQLTLISASHGYRYLLVSLDSRNHGDELIGWLGHELMHAVEVAGAPEVQDADTMRRFFARIACTGSADAGYETTAAVDAGRRVLAEVWATTSARR